MTANYQMGEANLEALRKELGPLGDGIYYLWNAIAPSGESGDKLTGWCLAINQNHDMFFLKTEGYYSGYLEDHPPKNPNPSRENHFWPSGIDVKSRESEARFMVLRPFWNDAYCSYDNLREYAEWWNGYEVTGEEKDYYTALIKAAEEEQARRRKAKQEQARKAREEENEELKDRKELRKKDPESYRRLFPQEALKRDIRKNSPESYRQMYPEEAEQREQRKLRKESPEEYRMRYPNEWLEREKRKIQNGGVYSDDDDSDDSDDDNNRDDDDCDDYEQPF
ncbi:uncharacterized protein BO95DRAFT_463062 [Aspergillus brunneoviolaceus CBS 621.78]|uniref:Uncharacterized protein n=1 Tax=Aspergillus brunneoviolaceus CBS 621.78 TaxID=1450534 RepID=A0ACD1GAU5_9EURO|nr:hypothetical protein BO95DRAFT_463062 [Aspergillus brunneoviolaceus CBS 621.78]RAH46293.1 hypothetical protein BO95DRAFT_463062 [Aspergillus brunneoviolaceus CBS 621.78]